MQCWENGGGMYTLTRHSDYDDDEPLTAASTPEKYVEYKKALLDYFSVRNSRSTSSHISNRL